MYSPEVIQGLNAIAAQYSDILRKSIVDVLSRYSNTGAGAASVTVEVIPGTADRSPQLVVKFDDHVLFLDKRRLQWTKLPDMRNLMAWAQTKKSNEQEARKLAWAVAWDKKNNDTWKPKRWRKQGLGPALKEMNQRIMERYEKELEAALNKAIKVS
jgi:hypothetical protein